MPAVSLLVLALVAQPLQHRVEVLGRGGDAFSSAGVRGGDLWERVRGDVRLEARRSGERDASAQLSLHLTRGAERWSIELTALRPGSLLIDTDLPGPGGLVHAAVVLEGTARITRAGERVSDNVSLRALALTTGFHADDGTFRALPAGRSGDLELLVQLDGLPEGALEVGFEHPEMTLDGRPVSAAPLADATAPAWPGARGGSGVGGSGNDSSSALYGSTAPLPPPPPPSRQTGGMESPSTPPPANAAPAGPLPPTPPPASSAPATAFPTAPAPSNAAPGTVSPATPPPGNASGAPLLPATPAPGNGSPVLPLPSAPAPANSSPALPLPSTPAPSSTP